nr:MAG TPA: hypothetical protein [Caudoviricetes sp.]
MTYEATEKNICFERKVAVEDNHERSMTRYLLNSLLFKGLSKKILSVTSVQCNLRFQRTPL